MRKCIYKDKKRNDWFIHTKVKINDHFYEFKRRGFSTKAEADASFDKLLQDFIIQKSNNQSYILFDGLKNAYLVYMKTRVRSSTFHQIETLLSKYFSFSNTITCSETATIPFLNDFKERIGKLNYKSIWKNKILSIFRKLVDYGFKNGYYTLAENQRASNILESFKNTSTEVSDEKRSWTREEYKAFISTFSDDDKYKYLFEIFFFLGCRTGELLGLQWKDYSRQRKTIYIHQQAATRLGYGRSIITTTKTRQSVRYIDLSDSICDKLDLLKNSFLSNDDHFIFFGGNKPLGATTIRRVFDTHINMARIPKITLHGIRHTNCSWLISNINTMEDIIVISKRLGHGSTKQTLDTYSHMIKRKQSDLLSIFE